jgi:SAM-dependent methyltransferase
MPLPNEVYVKCDELDNIPKLNKDNWLKEIELLSKEFPLNSKVLQIGCMDGTRIIALLDKRPDLKITGLDIEGYMVEKIKENLKKYNYSADVILGDITKPVGVSGFDYVICLNNTLGYIFEEEKAINNMRGLGDKVIISVYGEKFDDSLGKDYFKAINLEVERIENNIFITKDFTNIKRYTRKDVEGWNPKEVIETPIGYLCILN